MTAIRVLAGLATLAALYFGSSIFIPLIGGFFLFFLLDPIVVFLEKKNVPRALSSLGLVILSFVVSGFLIWTLYGAVANVAKEVPSYSKKLSGIVDTLRKRADLIKSGTQQVIPEVTKDDVQKVEVVGGEMGSVTGVALRGLGTIFDVLTTALFIPLITLFVLWEKKHLSEVIRQVLASSFNLTHIRIETTKMLKAFFGGNLIIGVVMAIILAVEFSILGLKNSVSLGVLSGFLNLIPLLGPLISIVLPLIAALLQFNTPAPFIVIVGTVAFLHLFITNFVIPKIVGRHVNVNATASTLGLLVWGWLWGAVGLLLAVPLMAMIRIVLEANPPTEKVSRLLADSGEDPGKS